MSALDVQEGGGHYKDMPIQVVEFCQKNKLNYCESNVIKYVCRHKKKNGLEDLKKAKHYIDLLIELEYGEPPVEWTTHTTYGVKPADHYVHLREDSGC